MKAILTGILTLTTLINILGKDKPAKSSIEITDLKGVCRNGQTFLTWNEKQDLPPGTTFNVYASSSPINSKNLNSAKLIARYIHPGSTRNWSQDPASFKRNQKPTKPVGLKIKTGEKELSPSSGLFAHTITGKNEKMAYYAITASLKNSENKTIKPGMNSLRNAVSQKKGEILPVWLKKNSPLTLSATEGKALLIQLHGFGGGGKKDYDCVFFGDAKQGWREGLPFFLNIKTSANCVYISPSDRMWIGRPLEESMDKRDWVPAVSTFWYGCNSNIYDAKAVAQGGTPTNYSEKRIMGIIKWALETLKVNPEKIYLKGGSMGGSGTLSIGTIYPEKFAALRAQVPIVSYRGPGEKYKNSAWRLERTCGSLKENPKANDGVPIIDRMDGSKRLMENIEKDMPFIVVVNGRSDKSIPWKNNPDYYRALNDSKRGFFAYWDNGGHSTAGSDKMNVPPDVKKTCSNDYMFRFSKNESFPAFSNCSSNKNPGNGDPKDGDITGWMNRGMEWKILKDEPDEYSIEISADFPGIKYPVKVDMTPRRTQKFKLKPGEKIKAFAGDKAKPRVIKADKHGLATLKGILIPSKSKVTIIMKRI